MSESRKYEVCASSNSLAVDRNPSFEVTWTDADKENPRNWPVWYRCFVVAATSFSTTIVYVCYHKNREIMNNFSSCGNRIMYSTMYTSGANGMRETFHSSETVVLLGLTTNLFGLAIGGVVLSSLSEMYGRRPVYLVTVLLFGVFVLPVALARNVETILISRFISGFFGGVMISSGPGSVVDVTDEEYRALALSCWSLGSMNGPVLGMCLGV